MVLRSLISWLAPRPQRNSARHRRLRQLRSSRSRRAFFEGLEDRAMMANDLTLGGVPVDVTEGGATDSYTLFLDTDPGAGATVDLDIAAGSQLEVSLDNVTFSAAVTVSFDDVNFPVPKTVFVRALDDAVVEGSHLGAVTQTVNASSNSAVYTDGLLLTGVVANITDNDATTVSIAANDAAAAEAGSDPGQFTVTLDGGKIAPLGGITVNYSISGTATNGVDYALLTGLVVIPSGLGSATIDVSGVVDDNIIEDGGETVDVTLTSTLDPSVTVGAANTATVVIADDDATTVSIVASDAAADETGSDPGQFTLTLAGGKVAPAAGITVNYAIAGTATNGVDYALLTGSVLVTSGLGTAIIDVSGVVDDNIIEDGGETVDVTLTSTLNASVTVGAPDTASVVIADNDATTVSIVASDPTAAETGADSGQFTVTFAGGKVAPAAGIVVNYSIAGTAAGGLDYTALTGSVTVLSGSGTAVIDVSVNDDRRVEGTESVELTLTSTNNGSVTLDPIPANNTATVTITDNDTALAVFASSGIAVAEDFLTLSRGVDLNLIVIGAGTPGLDRSITVRVASSGTASNGAAVGDDFLFASPTDVLFSPADGLSFSQNVGLTTVDDLAFEGNESVNLGLAMQSDGTGGQASLGATILDAVTIVDDDTAAARRFDVPSPDTYRIGRTAGNINIEQSAVLIATEPLAAFSVTTNGTTGDDSFIVDYAGGNPVPSLGLALNAAAQVVQDDLAITGGSATLLSYNFSAAKNGSIGVDGSAITFTDLEMNLQPIADDMSVLDRQFDFDVGAEVITVAVAGVAGFDTRFSSATGEAVNTTNSSRLLMLNTGAADDSINLDSFGGTFSASLNVNAGAQANDTITTNTNLSLGSAIAAGDLALTSARINLNAPSNITTWRHQDYQGNVSLMSATSNLSTVAGGADASDGNITFAQTVDGATAAGHNLMLTAGQGNLMFTADVGTSAARKVVDVQVASAKVATVMTNVFTSRDVMLANISQQVDLAASAMIDAQRNISAPTAAAVAKINLLGMGGTNMLKAGGDINLALVEDSGAPSQLTVQADQHITLQKVLLNGNTPADADDPQLSIDIDQLAGGVDGNLALNDIAGLQAGVVIVKSKSSEAINYNVMATRADGADLSVCYLLSDNGVGANDSSLNVTDRGGTPIAIQAMNSGKNVDFLVGDNVSVGNQVSILAKGKLRIAGDHLGADAGVGTTITIAGSSGLIGGNGGGMIEGAVDDDTVITAPERFRGGDKMEQFGRDGNDRFRLNYLANFDGPGVATPYTIDGGSGNPAMNGGVGNILDVNTAGDAQARKNQFTYTNTAGTSAKFLTNVASGGSFSNTAEADWTLASLDSYVVRGGPTGLDQTVIVGQAGAANAVTVGDINALTVAGANVDRPAAMPGSSELNQFGVSNSELVRVIGGAMADNLQVNVGAASSAKFAILEGMGSPNTGTGEVLQGTKAATNLVFGASNAKTLLGKAGFPVDNPIGQEPNRVTIYAGGFTTADPNVRDFIFADYFRRIDPLTGQGLALGQLLGGNFRDIIQSGNSVVQAAGANDRLGQDPTQIGSGSITAFFNGSVIDVVSWLRARFPGITELGINVADAGTFGSAEFLVKAFDHRLINSVSAPPPPPGGVGIGTPIFTAPVNVNLGDQVNLSASGATGNGLTYRWTITQPDLTTFPLTGKDASFVARFPGSYKVSLTVANSDGASAVLAPQFVSSNPIAGNIVNATISSGLLTLTGTAGVNDVVIELGTSGINSARVKGQNGTQIKFGATTFASGTFVPFANLSRGINTSMLGGADRLVLSGTNLRSAVRLDGGAGDDAYVISTRNIQITLADSSGNDVLNFAGMAAGINLDLSQSTVGSPGTELEFAL